MREWTITVTVVMGCESINRDLAKAYAIEALNKIDCDIIDIWCEPDDGKPVQEE